MRTCPAPPPRPAPPTPSQRAVVSRHGRSPGRVGRIRPFAAIGLWLGALCLQCGPQTTPGGAPLPDVTVVRPAGTPAPVRPAEDATPRPRDHAPELEPRLPLPTTPRTHPRLDDVPAHGSISVGTVTEGYLVDGRTLPPRGPHHEILAVHALRGTADGTDELVAAIQRVAAEVARIRPAAPLGVGNLSKGGGGDLPWSHSHNSGRDVDLSFYLVDGRGKPARPNDLLHVGPDGRCLEQPAWSFDDARNWAVVRAWLRDPAVAVQWIFVARPLRERLLAHAVAQHEPDVLLRRATIVLHQPAGVPPHDDHFHVRIHCATADALDGCRETGRRRLWQPDTAKALAARLNRLEAFGRAADAPTRAKALDLLRLLGHAPAAALFAEGLADRTIDVRAAALRGVKALGLAALAPTLGRAAELEADPALKEAMIEGLAQLDSPATLGPLERLLADTRTLDVPGPFWRRPTRIQRLAARAIVGRARHESLRPLVAALESDDPETAAYATEALQLLTNRETPAPTGPSGPAGWQDFARLHGKEPLDRWVADGFIAAGRAIPAPRPAFAGALVAAVADARKPISHNARRWLVRLAGQGDASLGWQVADASRFWARWCVRRYGAKRCRP